VLPFFYIEGIEPFNDMLRSMVLGWQIDRLRGCQPPTSLEQRRARARMNLLKCCVNCMDRQVEFAGICGLEKTNKFETYINQ
jgi:hypothetical protein